GLEALFIGEESPPMMIGSKPEVVIILDPLDGSTNFVKGIPFSSISVALASQGDGGAVDPFIGVVKDIAWGDVYYAEKGKGAYLNGSRLCRSKRDIQDKPLVSLYTYGGGDGEETALHTIRLNSHCNLRTLGSMALELCYLASSRLDGIVDIRGMLRLQDIAAGKLILEEAGCIISDGDGKPLDLRINHRYRIVAADSYERLRWLLKLLES
ncbi:MAG: inositol monophosphatase family protein, partial [Candidatus Bathyarchaeia archaeon]